MEKQEAVKFRDILYNHIKPNVVVRVSYECANQDYSEKIQTTALIWLANAIVGTIFNKQSSDDEVKTNILDYISKCGKNINQEIVDIIIRPDAFIAEPLSVRISMTDDDNFDASRVFFSCRFTTEIITAEKMTKFATSQTGTNAIVKQVEDEES